MPPKITQKIITDQDILNFTKHKEDIRIAAEQAKDIITREAVSASQAIAGAAELAAKAIASAAEVAVRVVSVKNADDHDLLIELKTGMGYLRADILALSNGVTQKITSLELGKADKKEFDALVEEIHGKREERMRSLENKIGNFMIYIGLLMAAIAGVFTLFGVHIAKIP